jgi:perosamine synthetase
MDFFTTHIAKNAKNQVNAVLESTFLSEGKLAEKFEKKIEEKLGIKNVVTVNSGTTALHLSLILADIKPGDEVILPAQTFIATGLVVLMMGAIPVFADIDLSTGNISTASIIEKINKKTKAIMPVHWAGYPCEMDEINHIAKKNNLIIIEDAAHAFGAKYKNVPIGSIADYTCFSFQAIKHITTGDGGAIAIKDEEKYLKAKTLRWFGIDRFNSKVGFLGEREYNLNELGYKYHLNDYSAALGLANLEDLDFILQRRKEITDFYKSKIIENDLIRFLNYKKENTSANWLFTIMLNNRNSFISYLKENEIPTSVVHLGIHNNDIFKKTFCNLENQNLFDNQQVSIPLHSNLTNNDINHIVDVINEWSKKQLK